MSVTTSEPEVSLDILDQVIGTGDVSKLTARQRVQFMLGACKSLGLNPLTRPFRFLSLNGQVQMYATKDCTDQLRSLRKINLTLPEKRLDGDIYVVTARAQTPEGRQDEDIGAVTIGKLMGDARANAMMKATTKAKRRVTLSICGLGLLSEDEVETIPGARIYDAEEPTPPPAETRREQINREIPMDQPPPRRTVGQFLDELEGQMRECGNAMEVAELIGSDDVQRALKTFKNGHKARLDGIIAQGIGAHAEVQHEDDSDGWPGPDPEQMRREREAAAVA